MYFTRQQMAGFVENAPGLAKPTNSKGAPEMEGNKAAAPSGQAHGRRVLGDIGNVVSAMPQRNPHAVGSKNFVSTNRPVTRKYVATLANNPHFVQDSQHLDGPDEKFCVGEKHQRALSSTGNNNDQMAHEVDMEDQMTSELTGPSVVQTQECCEVEMEDSVDPMSDIDEADAGDPMAVSEYVQDIYSLYKTRENLSCVPQDYMSQQLDINERMRAILIDWLIEVHMKFELMDETLFLTINIIDRYLSRHRVMRKHLQLVWVTAMLLACKYEEVSVPVVDDFVLISDNAYTKEEVLQMEKLILSTLQFNMAVPTPYVFMKRFLKVAQSDEETERLSFFFMELCLVEYAMLRYQPSILAAAAVYTAQCTLGRTPCWNGSLEWHSSYSESQLRECAKMMVHYHEKAGEGKLTCVYRKYSASKYDRVAKIEPALFIRDMVL
nr:cyclin B 2;3 [Larix kaempferi]